MRLRWCWTDAKRKLQKACGISGICYNEQNIFWLLSSKKVWKVLNVWGTIISTQFTITFSETFSTNFCGKVKRRKNFSIFNDKIKLNEKEAPMNIIFVSLLVNVYTIGGTFCFSVQRRHRVWLLHVDLIQYRSVLCDNEVFLLSLAIFIEDVEKRKADEN